MNENSRIQSFRPPPRPEWVRQINDEGRHLDIKGIVPLDAQSLIAQACANTGLTNFGADDWRDSFERMTRALDAEAELTLMGRIMTRSDLLMHLEGRLRVEEAYRRHPEIEDQEIRQPVLIVGSGRSGTSALLNLLSHDPNNATPRHKDALFPVPVDGRDEDELAEARMTLWNRVTPEIASMHEFSGDMPTEMIQLEALGFQANGWLDLYGFMPSWFSTLTLDHYRNSVGYARRILKLLQWRNRRTQWVLKSPDCMRYLPAVFEVFPDVKLVWVHRDPVKAVSSAVSLIGTLFYIRSDQLLSPAAIAQLTNPSGLAGLFDTVLDLIDSGVIPQSQVYSVQYEDLTSDPLATVEKLYADLGIKLKAEGRAAIKHYIDQNPRTARPKHHYSVGDSVSEERKLFERYETRFAVPREV